MTSFLRKLVGGRTPGPTSSPPPPSSQHRSSSLSYNYDIERAVPIEVEYLRSPVRIRSPSPPMSRITRSSPPPPPPLPLPQPLPSLPQQRHQSQPHLRPTEDVHPASVFTQYASDTDRGIELITNAPTPDLAALIDQARHTATAASSATSATSTSPSTVHTSSVAAAAAGIEQIPNEKMPIRAMRRALNASGRQQSTFQPGVHSLSSHLDPRPYTQVRTLARDVAGDDTGASRIASHIDGYTVAIPGDDVYDGGRNSGGGGGGGGDGDDNDFEMEFRQPVYSAAKINHLLNGYPLRLRRNGRESHTMLWNRHPVYLFTAQVAANTNTSVLVWWLRPEVNAERRIAINSNGDFSNVQGRKDGIQGTGADDMADVTALSGGGGGGAMDDGEHSYLLSAQAITHIRNVLTDLNRWGLQLQFSDFCLGPMNLVNQAAITVAQSYAKSATQFPHVNMLPPNAVWGSVLAYGTAFKVLRWEASDYLSRRATDPMSASTLTTPTKSTLSSYTSFVEQMEEQWLADRQRAVSIRSTLGRQM